MNTTAEQHREKAAEHRQRAEESFQRCDTDGFLSQWASGLTAQEHDAKARIAEQGGRSVFWGLYDRETGERVAARMVSVYDKFKFEHVDKWVLDDAEAERRGRKWIPTGGRSRVQKQLGLVERREWAAADAGITGRGTGLSGTAWVHVYRVHKDGSDAVALTDEENARYQPGTMCLRDDS